MFWGADWQLSIGADVKECELVKGSREVNGQEVEGPFYHIKKSTLREVSVVAVGADAHTNMKVNAKFNLVNQEGEAMNNKSETKSVSAVSTPNDAAHPEKKPEPEQKPGNPANKAGEPANKPGEPEQKTDNAEKKPGQAAAEATPPAIQASAGDVAATAREAAQNAVRCYTLFAGIPHPADGVSRICLRIHCQGEGGLSHGRKDFSSAGRRHLYCTCREHA